MSFDMLSFDSDYINCNVFSIGDILFLKAIIPLRYPTIFFTKDPMRTSNTDILVISYDDPSKIKPMIRDNKLVVYTDKPIESLNSTLNVRLESPIFMIQFRNKYIIEDSEFINHLILKSESLEQLLNNFSEFKNNKTSRLSKKIQKPLFQSQPEDSSASFSKSLKSRKIKEAPLLTQSSKKSHLCFQSRRFMSPKKLGIRPSSQARNISNMQILVAGDSIFCRASTGSSYSFHNNSQNYLNNNEVGRLGHLVNDFEKNIRSLFQKAVYLVREVNSLLLNSISRLRD